MHILRFILQRCKVPSLYVYPFILSSVYKKYGQTDRKTDKVIPLKRLLQGVKIIFTVLIPISADNGKGAKL